MTREAVIAATRTPRRDPAYGWLPAAAGVAIEPDETERWDRGLGRGWEVIPWTGVGRRYGRAATLRGLSLPDMVAVHHGRRCVPGSCPAPMATPVRDERALG